MIVHDKPENRTPWGHHVTPGWCGDSSLYHYIFMQCFMPATWILCIVDTLQYTPKAFAFQKQGRWLFHKTSPSNSPPSNTNLLYTYLEFNEDNTSHHNYIQECVDLSLIYSVLYWLPEAHTSRNIIYDYKKCPTVRQLNQYVQYIMYMMYLSW